MDLPGPITVFAPVNAAFDKMTEGHLAYLSSPEVGTKEPFSLATIHSNVSDLGSHQTGGAAQEPRRLLGSGQFTPTSATAGLF